jgi:D-3-phosphoglycerate dehydrogenase
MSDKLIVVLDTGYKSYEYEKMLFTNAGYDFRLFPGNRNDRIAKLEFAREAVGVLIRWTKIDDKFLNATQNLKAIVRYGVGYDNIDVEAAIAHQVKVSIVQSYANQSVSDHTLALIYACARALPKGQKELKTLFGQPPIEKIFELHNKTLGIIGLGRIGSTFCLKAKPLFKKVLAHDPYIPDQRFKKFGASKSEINELLSESDVISLHCNLTDETKGLIDIHKFFLMRKRPVLINTSRGPVINENDLLTALNKGLIHSAGVDVFEDEPPLEKQDELLAHPNLIATGHYAWYSDTALKELQKRAADNLLSMLQNKIPDDCLNP